VSDALSSHVDLATTICALAGAEPDPGMRGVDQSPVFADPAARVRDYVLFAHDTAHTSRVRNTRYAIRGMFDGRHKYARYYGVGGGLPNDDLSGDSGRKLYDVDAAFDDHDHELYDLQEDPHELVNLAMDRGRRSELRARFDALLGLESIDFR
jgi:arylsulfatase A-like enzyme